jgi:catechol 2,3-dioxygenase-like lactoylglutathione lyase family enzyme
MPKIRHIAIRCQDTEQTARLFTEAFGMELVQHRGSGAVDLSDGDVNITLLPLGLGGGSGQPGFEHIGFTVENEDETKQRLAAAGATELTPINLGDVYYESKFKSREGLVIDVGHWAGTSPITATEPVAVSVAE